MPIPAAPTIGAAIKDLNTRLAGVATVLLSRDGQVISAEVPVGIDVETSAMTYATLYGAAATANAELGRSPPDRIVVEGVDGIMVMVRSGRTGILAAVLGPACNVSNAVNEVGKFARLPAVD